MTTQQMNLLTLEQVKELCQNPDRIMSPPSQLVSVLETLGSQDEEVRAWASDCLQELPDLDDHHAAEVAAYCQHSNPYIANRACLVLAKATHLERFQSSLTRALSSHSSVGVKQSAAATLGELNNAALETRVALEEAAKNSDARLQRLAKLALEKFD